MPYKIKAQLQCERFGKWMKNFVTYRIQKKEFYRHLLRNIFNNIFRFHVLVESVYFFCPCNKIFQSFLKFIGSFVSTIHIADADMSAIIQKPLVICRVLLTVLIALRISFG